MLSVEPTKAGTDLTCAICDRPIRAGDYHVAASSDLDTGSRANLCTWCFLHSIDDDMQEYVVSMCDRFFPREAEWMRTRLDIVSKASGRRTRRPKKRVS